LCDGFLGVLHAFLLASYLLSHSPGVCGLVNAENHCHKPGQELGMVRKRVEAHPLVL
jgi:hypothetical protein